MWQGRECHRKTHHPHALGRMLGAARPSGAARCHPSCPINYSRVAPNRFHFKSSETQGKRKAARDKGGCRYGFDTH